MASSGPQTGEEAGKRTQGDQCDYAISFCVLLAAFAENPELRVRFLQRPCRCQNSSNATVCATGRTVKVQYVLKGLNENPGTRMGEKRAASLSCVEPPARSIY